VDAVTQAQIEHELEAHVREPFAMILEPTEILTHAAMIQLALSHPDIQSSVRADGEGFLECVRHYFRHCPTVLRLLGRGAPLPVDEVNH
jgi:hypothetical protein